MNKKEFTIFTLFLMFIVLPELHLLMNSMAQLNVDLFLFCDKIQDIQWYVKDSLDIIGLILLSCALVLMSPNKIRDFAITILIINVLKLPLYWLFYIQFDWAINILIFTVMYIKYLIK
jgi:hypothetical protein